MPPISSPSASFFSDAFRQLPSYNVARLRHEFAAFNVTCVERLTAIRGRTYPKRCEKAAGIMAASFAALPGQLGIAPAVFLMAPLPQRIAKYRRMTLPYVAGYVPSWGLMAGACALGGTAGAQKLVYGAPDAPSTPQRSFGSSSQEGRSTSPRWEQTLSDVIAYGVLGKAQLMIQAFGKRRAADGHRLSAFACQMAAAGLLLALECVRLPLQLALLTLELVPAVPLALLGSVVGLAVFLWTPHDDLWSTPIADEADELAPAKS